MPVYQIMRESFRTDQGFLPGLVWVYDGHMISLAALSTYEPQRASRQAQIDDSLNSGYHTDAIWEYLGQQGGQHMMSMRGKPEVLVAPNLKAALDAALASLYTTR